MDFEEVLDHLLHLDPHTRSLGAIYDTLFLMHGQSTGRNPTRWGNKTPRHVFSIPLLTRVFPSAKFVHMLRDGADVVPSLIKMNPKGYSIENAATFWCSAVHAFGCFQKSYPYKCMQVRYEDLVLRTEETITSLCEFLNLPFDPDMLATTEVPQDVVDIAHHTRLSMPIDGRSLGKGRMQLSHSERQELGFLINDLLLLHGYEPIKA